MPANLHKQAPLISKWLPWHEHTFVDHGGLWLHGGFGAPGFAPNIPHWCAAAGVDPNIDETTPTIQRCVSPRGCGVKRAEPLDCCGPKRAQPVVSHPGAGAAACFLEADVEQRQLETWVGCRFGVHSWGVCFLGFEWCIY